MILFLYTFSINRARTSGKFYEELIRRKDENVYKIVDISVLSISQVQQEIDKVDLVVFDNSIILSMGNTPLHSKNFYYVKRSKEFFLDVWDRVDRSGKPVFFLHPSSDLHAVNFGLDRNLYLSFIKRLSGICWPYFKSPFSSDESEDRYPFTTLQSYQLTKNLVQEIWHEVKSTVPVNIDFPHCIPYDTLLQKSKRKLWDIIVPGVSYATRRIARESIMKSDLHIAPFTGFSKWLLQAPYMFYSKIFSEKKSTLVYQEKSFRLYRYMISMSRISFACGSELRYFVRKFIEIPAFRSAMIAYPSLNFRDYGFEDGIHFLQSFPEEAGEKARYLLKHPELADKLVQNAWELVAKEHTAAVRVSQVLACLKQFSEGKLKGAGYNEGKFEIF